MRRVDALVGRAPTGSRRRSAPWSASSPGLLGARPDELADRVSSLVGQLKEAEKELAALRQAPLLAQAGTLAAGAQTVGETRVVTHDAGEVASGDDLRTLALDVRWRLGEPAPSVVAVGGASKGRPVVVVATNAAAREHGVRAGALVGPPRPCSAAAAAARTTWRRAAARTPPAREALAGRRRGGARLT